MLVQNPAPPREAPYLSPTQMFMDAESLLRTHSVYRFNKEGVVIPVRTPLKVDDLAQCFFVDKRINDSFWSYLPFHSLYFRGCGSVFTVPGVSQPYAIDLIRQILQLNSNLKIVTVDPILMPKARSRL